MYIIPKYQLEMKIQKDCLNLCILHSLYQGDLLFLIYN